MTIRVVSGDISSQWMETVSSPVLGAKKRLPKESHIQVETRNAVISADMYLSWGLMVSTDYI